MNDMIRKIAGRLQLLVDDRRWWVFFMQRCFMNPAMRNRLAARVARLMPEAQSGQLQADVVSASQALATAGIARLGEVLSPSACEDLCRYFRRCEVSDPYREGSLPFLPDSVSRHPDTHIAHHSPQDVLRAPYLLALANDPRILKLASEFLGCRPTIGFLAAWWSYQTGKGAQEAELFHRDVDDWKFVKLFVYLTNVGPENGPHVYVQNSSTSTRLTRIARFSDDEVRDAFGAENILTITAPAGQAFLEDTFGIHKGQPVIAGTRLIFQAVYSMSTLPYSPKQPVLSRSEVAFPRLDPWINRAYIA
jgi:hypothetical protein